MKDTPYTEAGMFSFCFVVDDWTVLSDKRNEPLINIFDNVVPSCSF